MNGVFSSELEHYSLVFDFSVLKGKTVFVTGATGNVGSVVVKFLLALNRFCASNIKIVCLARSMSRAQVVFGPDLTFLTVVVGDVLNNIAFDGVVDYIIHGANITDSRFYTQNPVDTIITIINGTKCMLDFAREKKVRGFVYLSSMEVYGTLTSDCLEENSYGHIDFLSTRSSYSEGKRMAECLCHAYAMQYGVRCMCARLAQLVGVGIAVSDTRFPSFLVRSIIQKKDVVLQTDGSSVRNSIYTLDAVTGILFVLLFGMSGESYNVSAADSSVSIAKTAQIVLGELHSDSRLVFDIKENSYAPTTCINLSNKKLRALGWTEKTSYIDSYKKLYAYLLEAGGEANFKITTPTDLEKFAEIQAREVKT